MAWWVGGCEICVPLRGMCGVFDCVYVLKCAVCLECRCRVCALCVSVCVCVCVCKISVV